jgi:hypothetical protein
VTPEQRRARKELVDRRHDYFMQLLALHNHKGRDHEETLKARAAYEETVRVVATFDRLLGVK